MADLDGKATAAEDMRQIKLSRQGLGAGPKMSGLTYKDEKPHAGDSDMPTASLKRSAFNHDYKIGGITYTLAGDSPDKITTIVMHGTAPKKYGLDNRIFVAERPISIPFKDRDGRELTTAGEDLIRQATSPDESGVAKVNALAGDSSWGRFMQGIASVIPAGNDLRLIANQWAKTEITITEKTSSGKPASAVRLAPDGPIHAAMAQVRSGDAKTLADMAGEDGAGNYTPQATAKDVPGTRR